MKPLQHWFRPALLFGLILLAGGGRAIADTSFIHITSPANGAVFNGNTSPSVFLSATPAAGTQPNSVVFYIDGVPHVASNNVGVQWSYGEGHHTIIAQVLGQNNERYFSDPVVISFGRSTTPPQLRIGRPLNGETVTGITTIVYEAGSDLTFVNAVIDTTELYVNGILKKSGHLSVDSYSWDTNSAPPGPTTILLKGFNFLGTSATKEITVIVQRGTMQPPSATRIQITSPSDGSVVKGSVPIAILTNPFTTGSLQIAKNGLWNITWNLPATPGGVSGSWDTVFGEHDEPVTLIARSPDGNGGYIYSDPVNTIVNNHPPTSDPLVALRRPGSDVVSGTVFVLAEAVNQGFEFFNGFLGNVELSVEGVLSEKFINNRAGGFYWDTTKRPDGPATLTAKVTDWYGNTSTVSRTVTVANSGTVVNPDPGGSPPVGGSNDLVISGSQVACTPSNSDARLIDRTGRTVTRVHAVNGAICLEGGKWASAAYSLIFDNGEKRRVVVVK